MITTKTTTRFVIAALSICVAITAARTEQLVETKSETVACKRAQEAMAKAYREKAPDRVQDRLADKYACACGAIYPTAGPVARCPK